MHTPGKRGLLPALLAAALLAPHALHAQVLYGTLVGTVTDNTQAVIPGATVVVTSQETNQTRQSLTNAAGEFNFPTIPSGKYTVRVTKDGFQTRVQQDVEITINNVTRTDFSLEVGRVSESVQVSAAAPALQTDRAEVREEITTRRLRDLPVPPGRNYQGLFRTLPGFTPPANAHSIPSNPSRALTFNVNGTTRSSVNVRIDGASSTNAWLPHMTAYVPALESIETVNVVTNSFDAEQGLAGGAAVNVQIKSGTNELHGSGFWYHNNNVTKAKPFFLPAGERKPKQIFNQYGGTLGGPIKKDKLFYFLSYEGTNDRQFAQRFATVPTAAMRRGDFSESTRPVYDPMTGRPDGSGRTPFPGNIIPPHRINPISKRIAEMTPLPTFHDVITSNYYASAPFSFDRNTLDSKVNWIPTQKLTMFTRVSYLGYDTFNRQFFGDALGGPPINGGNPGRGFGSTWSASLAGTYVLGPNFIIDGNFGYTLMDTNVEQPNLDKKIGSEVLGIPGTNGPRRFEGGWPRISVSNYTNLGINETYMPYFRNDPQYQYVANANWTKGSHSIRFGFDSYRQNLNHTQPEFAGASHGASGGFTFAGGPTTVKGGPASNQFNSYATFLLGLVTNRGRINQVPDVYTTRTWSHSLYARDQWRVNRKLNVSYGLRWEYFPFPRREDRGLERFDFNTGKMMVCGVGSVPTDCGTKVSMNNYAPRLGFAYRPTETFVIRAGYGITNDPFNVARNLRTNYPLLLVLNESAASAFGWVSDIREGIPQMNPPSLGDGIIDIPAAYAVNSPGARLQRGYVQSWNFTLQKEIFRGTTVQAGYVASRTVRQLGYLDQNAGLPGGGRASQPLFQKFGRITRTAIVQPIGHTKYDSLQTKFERRFATGFSFNAAYTFSKAVGICCNDNSDGTPAIQIPQYYHLNRSLMSFDRTHNLQMTSVFELPFGKGKPMASTGWASKLFGGWQVNGLFSAYSGTPFTVTSSGTSLNAPGNTQRADLVGTPKKLGNVGRGQAFYDPGAFAPVIEPRFGTAGFNILRGPGAVNLDAGLFRRFSFNERVSLQFRAEAFNLTNTPHFSNPSNNISNLRLNPDGTFQGGVFEVTGVAGTGREGIDERVIRFGLRLGF